MPLTNWTGSSVDEALANLLTRRKRIALRAKEDLLAFIRGVRQIKCESKIDSVEGSVNSLSSLLCVATSTAF